MKVMNGIMKNAGKREMQETICSSKLSLNNQVDIKIEEERRTSHGASKLVELNKYTIIHILNRYYIAENYKILKKLFPVKTCTIIQKSDYINVAF